MATHKIRLYIAEEQQILRDAYSPFFASHPSIELLGSTTDVSTEALVNAGKTLRPSVILFGSKVFNAGMTKTLEVFRDECPDIGLVLLTAHFDAEGIKALRQFSRGLSKGCAFLMKQGIDTVEQIGQVVTSTAEGRVIVDPELLGKLVTGTEGASTVLKDLSPRELEVLNWMARGYRNETIAEVLTVDVKTVERHINGIYGKLGNSPPSRHPRVHVVTMYLKAVGQLQGDPVAHNSET